MFRIKICGITCVEDALATARAGADAIGLNFYPRSPRYVAVEAARQIMAVLPTEMVAVGLFVNTPSSDVCRLCDELQLDLIQLHGDEPPEYLALLGARPIMRAFRVGADGLQPVLAYLDRCRELAAMPRLTLLDSPAGAKFGGTGQTGDWSAAAEYAQHAAEANLPALVLAGGLTPENVAAAIQAVHPAAVDVATGVESSPGRKDPAVVEAFVQAARLAF
jgi:phosphoribosylanthranilate isomerase